MTSKTPGTGRVLGQLDIDQRRVVTHTLDSTQNLHVVAGAGSGKTRCMAHRVGYLIEAGIDPERICAISFSKKSGAELEHRISTIHRQGYKVQASTYHSLGFRWLKRWGIGEDLANNSLDAHLFEGAYREVLPDTPDDGPHPYFPLSPKAVGTWLKRLKQEGHTQAAIKTEMADVIMGGLQIGPELSRIAMLYEANKRKRKLVTFLDMIWGFWHELATNKEHLRQVASSIDYLLVDEVQDLSHLQHSIVELLAPTCQVMTVGDPRQSIYGFRGASLERLEGCLKNLSPKREALVRNYRSGHTIVALGNVICQGSELAHLGESKSVRGIDGAIEIWRPRHEGHEADEITDRIEQMIARGEDPREICVLYRNNALACSLETTLTSRGIPNIVVGSIRFAERHEVRVCLELIKLVLDPSNIEAATYVYQVPARGLGQKTWGRVRRAHTQDALVYQVMREVATSGSISTRQAKALEEFADQLESLAALSAWSPSRVLDEIFFKVQGTSTSLFEWFNKADDEDNQRAENLLALREFCAQHRELSRVLALLEGFGEDGGEQDAVRLMTIHKSKGLEFSHVFVAGCSEVVLSGSEEDQRVLYVAATRAKNELVLSAPRRQYGKPCGPSVWLEDVLEVLGVDLEAEEKRRKEEAAC